MKTYIAWFEKAEEGGYLVQFPDLPGCLSEGDSWEEAFEMAVDALALWLANQGNPWPRSSSYTQLQRQTSPQQALVSVPVDEHLLFQYQPKSRINVSLPKKILIDLDQYRAQTGEERSDLLAQGAQLLLEHRLSKTL